MNEEKVQDRIRNAALVMVLLNAFATPLMLSAANVALPEIAKDLNIHAVMLSWIPMAYLMASATFVLIFGRLADMYGRKRLFMMGTSSVILTSLLAAAAPDGNILIFARFLQGVSAAMLYATQIAIISSIFPPQKRGRAIGLTVSMIYLGLTFGPVAGGFLIEFFGWRASFIFHVPLAIIVLLIGFFWVPGEWISEDAGAFDIRGAILYSVSIFCLCIGVSGLPELYALVSVMAGILGMTIFFNVARHTAEPIFDVKLFFTNKVFTRSSLASLMIYTATFANVVLVSLYLQYLKGMSPSSAGLFMMIQPLTMAVFSPFTGRLSDRIEPRIIASAGMLLTATGLTMLAVLNGVNSLPYLASALIITGMGFSLFSSPNVNAIMSSIEKRYYGSASGSIATMRVLGQMSSMMLVALVFALFIGQVEIVPENYALLQKAIQISFSIAAMLCLPGLYFSIARGKIHAP